MIQQLGQHFSDAFKRYMPNAFVFALILTLLVAGGAWVVTPTSATEILEAWYGGFWQLLEFGMQMCLLIVTGYCIALSPYVDHKMNQLAQRVRHPVQVYLIVIYFGMFAALVSWGWVVIAAILGRSLAQKVNEVHYPFLIACAYLSKNIWSTGLSSSIPLLLNTEENYLIEAGILDSTISTEVTLGSPLNLSMIALYLIVTPLLMIALRPRSAHGNRLQELLVVNEVIKNESPEIVSHTGTISDRLNHSKLLVLGIGLAGLIVVSRYFSANGFDLNLNLMIFIFMLLGMALHQTPIRYGLAVQKASGNVSPILYQFPFYAGIMGIMTQSGLGSQLALSLANISSVSTLPSFAFILGGMVNFAIPSGGGEFAVIGPSLLEAAQALGSSLPPHEQYQLSIQTIMALTYGESLTNLMQPFFILIVLPVMAAGTKLQARDVMGYLVIPFVVYFCLQLLLINLIPVI